MVLTALLVMLQAGSAPLTRTGGGAAFSAATFDGLVQEGISAGA